MCWPWWKMKLMSCSFDWLMSLRLKETQKAKSSKIYWKILAVLLLSAMKKTTIDTNNCVVERKKRRLVQSLVEMFEVKACRKSLGERLFCR